jgi:hypothetical protein
MASASAHGSGVSEENIQSNNCNMDIDHMVTENISNNTTTSDKVIDKHPWPYLAELFRFNGVKGNSVIMTCLLCKPQRAGNTGISAYINSPSNLKKHIEVGDY